MSILTKVDLRQQVESELACDPHVSPFSAGIGVAADRDVVTLTGDVPSYAAKLAAEQAAVRVHGVKTVANDLNIKPRCEHNDADIAADVARALRAARHVPLTVKATVRDGCVTLEGAVKENHQRLLAAAAVRQVSGVRAVSDLLVTQPD